MLYIAGIIDIDPRAKALRLDKIRSEELNVPES